MKLMTGNSNKPLAAAIADYIEIPLTDASVRRFADEEVFVEIHENVRGEDVFVLQSTSYPTNDNLMELLIMIDALKRASAKRITAVVPYFARREPDGSYTLTIHPALENFPTDDLSADAVRINRLIEDNIRLAPEQYFWVHKRFKTRGEGYPDVY